MDKIILVLALAACEKPTPQQETQDYKEALESYDRLEGQVQLRAIRKEVERFEFLERNYASRAALCAQVRVVIAVVAESDEINPEVRQDAYNNWMALAWHEKCPR